MANLVIDFNVKNDEILATIDLLEKIGQVEKGTAEEFRKSAAIRKTANDAAQAATQETINETERLTASLKELPKAIAGGAVTTAIKNIGDQAEKTEKKTTSLKQQLRAMKNELATLDEGSSKFTKLSIEAAKLEDKIGDVQARVRNLASDTKGINALISGAQGITGAFAIAEGAIGLFGTNSEEMQKTLLKVNSAMAILQGLQQIQVVLFEESAAKSYLAAAAQGVYNYVVSAGTAQLKLFRIALVSTGIGAVVIALTYLISKFMESKQATEDSTKSQNEFQESLKRTGDKLRDIGDEAEDSSRRVKVALGEMSDFDAQRAKAKEDFDKKALESEMFFNQERKSIDLLNREQVQTLALKEFEYNERLLQNYNNQIKLIDIAEKKDKLERDKKAKGDSDKIKDDELTKAKKHAQDLIDNETNLFNKLTEAHKGANRQKEDDTQKQLDAELAAYDVYLRQLQINYDRDVAAYDAAQKRKEDIQNASFQAATDTIKALQGFNEAALNNELNSLNQQLASKQISQAEYDERSKKAKMKSAQQDKELNSFLIIINTALAIIKAMATAPNYVVGLIESAGAAALGAAQLAVVQSKSAPGFKKGTKDAPGGFKWVGEDGPELIHTPGHDTILPHRKSVEFAKMYFDSAMPQLPIIAIPQSSQSSQNGIDYVRLGREFAKAMKGVPAGETNVYINNKGSDIDYYIENYKM